MLLETASMVLPMLQGSGGLGGLDMFGGGGGGSDISKAESSGYFAPGGFTYNKFEGSQLLILVGVVLIIFWLIRGK